MRYRFKSGSRISGLDAETAATVLENLRRENAGRLRPEDVLSAAAPEQHPLHGYFEWDDSTAAQAYRLSQAGHLIRCVEVVFEESPSVPPTRAFVHVLQKGDEDETYTSISHAMSRKDLRNQVLGRALSEAKRWADQYKHVKELAEVRRAVQLAFRKHERHVA